MLICILETNISKYLNITDVNFSPYFVCPIRCTLPMA